MSREGCTVNRCIAGYWIDGIDVSTKIRRRRRFAAAAAAVAAMISDINSNEPFHLVQIAFHTRGQEIGLLFRGEDDSHDELLSEDAA